MITIIDQLSRERADTFSLVLDSAGIGNRVIRSDNGFHIDVPESLAGPAQDAIRCYQKENPIAEDWVPANNPLVTRLHLSGIAVALLLLTVHLAIYSSVLPEDYITVFGADSRRILNGEPYRCVTALWLHADDAHLAGNMAGIALFGTAVTGFTGPGVGWLMILASGFLGNWFNAYVYKTGHLSIGASTMVFGAVGLLCSLQVNRSLRTGRGWKRIFLAMGGGLALLAFLGTSARSDVGAHLFGFLAGILFGGAHGLWTGRPFGNKVQIWCGIIAVWAPLWAWIQGALK